MKIGVCGIRGATMKRTYGLDEDHRPVKMGEKVLDLRSGRTGKIIQLPLANSLWATMLADNGRAYLVSLDKLEPVGDDGQADRPKPAPDPHLDRAAFQPELFERG